MYTSIVAGKCCDPTMNEQRYEGHSVHENTTSQYKNIYQDKNIPDIFLLGYCTYFWMYCIVTLYVTTIFKSRSAGRCDRMRAIDGLFFVKYYNPRKKHPVVWSNASPFPPNPCCSGCCIQSPSVDWWGNVGGDR